MEKGGKKRVKKGRGREGRKGRKEWRTDGKKEREGGGREPASQGTLWKMLGNYPIHCENWKRKKKKKITTYPDFPMDYTSWIRKCFSLFQQVNRERVLQLQYHFSNSNKWLDLSHDHDDWVFCASWCNIYDVILLKKPHHHRIQSSFYIKVSITVYTGTERRGLQKLDRKK